MEYKKYTILENVTWCDQDASRESLRKWIRLFDQTENKLIPKDEIRPRQRDLLLSFYRPYLKDSMSGIYSTYQFENRWHVSPVLFDKDDRVTDNLHDAHITMRSAIKYRKPAIILNRNIFSYVIDRGEINPELQQARIAPSPENLLIASIDEDAKTELPQILCNLNLSSHDDEIIAVVRHLRKLLNVDAPTRPGKPIGSVRIEDYFLDVLIMLQLGIPVPEIYKKIKGSSALEKRTFEKQICVLLNFVDPEEIGQKNGKINSEFLGK